MQVRVTFGRMAGEVIDLPVPSARAMLADGRAVALGIDREAVSVPDEPTVTAHVAARSDRGFPRGKQRGHR